jgi:hypothetical protein
MKLGTPDGCLQSQAALVHHITQGDRRQKAVDLPTQRRPQIMGQAFFAVGAPFDGVADATGYLKRLVDR